MMEFRTSLEAFKNGSTGCFIGGFSAFDLIEVLELRIRRIENHLGMPIPNDLIRVRVTEGRKK
jgi:hypothetical protein